MRALFIAMTVAFTAFFASRAAEAEEPAPRREWFALGAGAAIPLKSGSLGGLAFSQELGRHWTSRTGEDGFATGFVVAEELRFPSSGAVSALLIQFRALWDFEIPLGSSALTIGPGVAGGVGLAFNGGTAGTDVAGLVTPLTELRFLFGDDRKFLLCVRPAVPIRIGKSTEAELLVTGGAGLRFNFF